RSTQRRGGGGDTLPEPRLGVAGARIRRVPGPSSSRRVRGRVIVGRLPQASRLPGVRVHRGAGGIRPGTQNEGGGGTLAARTDLGIDRGTARSGTRRERRCIAVTTDLLTREARFVEAMLTGDRHVPGVRAALRRSLATPPGADARVHPVVSPWTSGVPEPRARRWFLVAGRRGLLRGEWRPPLQPVGFGVSA